MFDLKAHLQELVEAHAPSGHEGPIRAIVRQSWDGLVDAFDRDGLGSLIGIKRATQPTEPARKIMLAAHMDEIALVVRDVVDGFLFVQRIAGIDPRVMMAQPVLVHGRRPLPGVVATVPPHMLTAEARRQYPNVDELVIDVGLSADEADELVQIGDLITVDVPLLALQNGRYAAKAFDDRACVAAVTVCLDELQRLQHRWDVYAVATVQEETGLIGAATAAHRINPDAAIALDVTFANQPEVPEDIATKMGGGVALGLGANFHMKMRQRLEDTAKRYDIPVQTMLIPTRSGTDAWAIQVAQEGVPTLLLSVPIRNMHSPVETLELRDIERTGRLMAQFIAGLDADFLTAIDFDELKALAKQE